MIGTESGAIRHPPTAVIISSNKAEILGEYDGIMDLRVLCDVSQVKIVEFAMLAGVDLVGY